MKAVIPAAGLGTRFLPATKAQPKEMLPVFNKPTIQYVVEEAVNSGIDDIIIITGKGKRSIEDHFDKSWELESNLEKKGKLDYLHEVQEIANKKSMALEGKTMPVLVEEVNEHDTSLVTGRLDNNSVVHFPGTADMIGNIYHVKLEECKGFYYLGTANQEAF